MCIVYVMLCVGHVDVVLCEVKRVAGVYYVFVKAGVYVCCGCFFRLFFFVLRGVRIVYYEFVPRGFLVPLRCVFVVWAMW